MEHCCSCYTIFNKETITIEKIKYFLKFGQREHLKSFISGNLYCSNPVSIWNIENKFKIKGQGDNLEASSKIFAQSVMVENGDRKETYENVDTFFRYEPAKLIPMFCLFTVFEKDCIMDKNGTDSINLSKEIKLTIKEHFPKADSVVIIHNPEQFLQDIETTIGYDMKHELIHYFNIGKGYEPSMHYPADAEYIKYLTQDTSPQYYPAAVKYSFDKENVYRVLFCKDVFFKNEQEYRIILPNEKIDKGTLYPVKFSSEYTIQDLDTFLQN